MDVEINPSYGDTSALTTNPCYEKPHVYEEIGLKCQDPIYSTILDIKVQPQPQGVSSTSV